MRILIISTTYLPSTIAVAKLVHDLATEIADKGHTPVILVPDPTIGTSYHYSTSNQISVLRFRSGRIKNTSMVRRAINEWRLSDTAWKNAKDYFLNNQFDLIVFFSPSIFWGNLVKRLKKMWKCPAYMVLRDIFPKWSVDAGLLKEHSIVYKVFKYKEFQQYNVSDTIGVQSPANLEYFKENKLDKKLNLEVLYNWVTTNSIDIPKDRDFRTNFGLEDKVVFFYGGRFSPAHDIDNLVRLAESLREVHSAHFLLLGNGSEFNRIKKLIVTKKVTNITIYPEVEQSEYLSMLSEFDVGLITLNRNLKTHNFPGKMLAYMQLSKPILASINPGNDLQKMLEKNMAGLVSVNGDDHKFKANALRLAADVNIRRQIGNNGFRLIESIFSVKKACSQIVSKGHQ